MKHTTTTKSTTLHSTHDTSYSDAARIAARAFRTLYSSSGQYVYESLRKDCIRLAHNDCADVSQDARDYVGVAAVTMCETWTRIFNSDVYTVDERAIKRAVWNAVYSARATMSRTERTHAYSDDIDDDGMMYTIDQTARANTIMHDNDVINALDATHTIQAIARTLSPTQRDILALLGRGWTIDAIAHKLGRKKTTIETHIARIRAKVGNDAQYTEYARDDAYIHGNGDIAQPTQRPQVVPQHIERAVWSQRTADMWDEYATNYNAWYADATQA